MIGVFADESGTALTAGADRNIRSHSTAIILAKTADITAVLSGYEGEGC